MSPVRPAPYMALKQHDPQEHARLTLDQSSAPLQRLGGVVGAYSDLDADPTGEDAANDKSRFRSHVATHL
jgi:hypothetical protein